jgi:ABC-type transport system involved in multi-copper enzyme maturation permease subunit
MRARFRRGFGPGPVFVYEWITASRRWQGYALRSLFVLGLLTALLVIVINRGGADAVVFPPPGLRALAQLGERFFIAVIGTQLTLVLLAAPAATAGAICLDRSRGTLTHLLATDLTDREIVLGKLAARLTPILTLVVATLPFMELITLLGGVDPDALLGAFVVTLGVAVLGCCLALVFSIWVRRTHEALLATYAVWGLWLLASPMLQQINRMTGYSLYVPPPTADPYLLAFAPYWRPGSVGWTDYLAFLAATWGISAILVVVAVRTMRRVCTRDGERKAARRFRRSAHGVDPATSRLSQILDRVGPPLDFNPILWREWHRNRPARWARIVAMLFIIGGVTFSLLAIYGDEFGNMSAFLNAFQVAIGLLLLSVIAATSLAEERVRGSLDVLLTTPMSTREIVIGKWLGTFRLVPLLAVLPLWVVIGRGALNDRQWPGVILTFAFVLAAGAAIASLGLAMATWCPRLGRAVGLTVSLYLLVTVGWLFAVMGMGGGPRESEMMGSPWFWSGQMTWDLRHDGSLDHWNAALRWTFAYGIAAAALLAATLLTFNRCLGRVEGRTFPSEHDWIPGVPEKRGGRVAIAARVQTAVDRPARRPGGA